MMGGFKFVLQKDGVFAEYYHVNNADIHYGDNVVVFGIGPVGLMAVAGTALKGAGRIYAIGTRPNGIISNVNFLDATDTINFPAAEEELSALSVSSSQAESIRANC